MKIKTTTNYFRMSGIFLGEKDYFYLSWASTRTIIKKSSSEAYGQVIGASGVQMEWL